MITKTEIISFIFRPTPPYNNPAGKPDSGTPPSIASRGCRDAGIANGLKNADKKEKGFFGIFEYGHMDKTKGAIMRKNIVITVLFIVVIVQAVLWRQTTQRLNSMANVTEWPEPLRGQTIVVDGMIYPDPVIRYAPDAVFPKISERIANDFMPDFVVYTNDQLKYTSELIAQAHWYHRHLKIALNLLEAERGLSQLPDQCAITPYEQPEYQPFTIDPDQIRDERCFSLLLNRAASTNYDILVGLGAIEDDIDNFYQRLLRLQPMLEQEN